jgi:hypothetical protein
MFGEKFKVLVSRIFGGAVRNLVIVGRMGILVGIVVYWAFTVIICCCQPDV